MRAAAQVCLLALGLLLVFWFVVGWRTLDWVERGLLVVAIGSLWLAWGGIR